MWGSGPGPRQGALLLGTPPGGAAPWNPRQGLAALDPYSRKTALPLYGNRGRRGAGDTAL